MHEIINKKGQNSQAQKTLTHNILIVTVFLFKGGVICFLVLL